MAIVETPRILLTSSNEEINEHKTESHFAPSINEGTFRDGLDEEEFCKHCGDRFDVREKIFQTETGNWHVNCFVCAQCFQHFNDGVFYEYQGRNYCGYDFHTLYAPCCAQCKEFIDGRVIKAMNANWHPSCFRCADCKNILDNVGFVKNKGRPLCHPCNEREKVGNSGRYMCHRCRVVVDANGDDTDAIGGDGREGSGAGPPLKYGSHFYHPYHFKCHQCGDELTHEAREKDGELYCLRCHDKMGIPICAACRRPIEDERVVHALGKTWHVDHFVCARCEKPFLGSRHYEKKGLAYCELHFQQLFGMLCYVCNQPICSGECVQALNKAWCRDHFQCSVCNHVLSNTTKFYDFDYKPVCKACYEHFPTDLRKRIAKLHKMIK